MRLKLKQRYKKCVIWFIKLFRQESSAECIARGAALGLLAALLIPIGLHTVTILLLGFMFRCNKITAMGVTFAFSNEFTIPIIYPLQCLMGSYIIGDPLTLLEAKNMLSGLLDGVTMAELAVFWEEIAIPYLIGGAILSAIAMPPGYYFALMITRKFKKKHAEKMLRRQITKDAHAAACATRTHL
jgi:uncharacterized protein (DUF2062 family)